MFHPGMGRTVGIRRRNEPLHVLRSSRTRADGGIQVKTMMFEEQKHRLPGEQSGAIIRCTAGSSSPRSFSRAFSCDSVNGPKSAGRGVALTGNPTMAPDGWHPESADSGVFWINSTLALLSNLSMNPVS